MRLRHKKDIENFDFGDQLIKQVDQPLVFNTPKVILEIGVGKGSLIKNSALNNPTITYVALEYNLTILQSLIKAKTVEKINNLIIINNQALNLPDFLSFSSLDEIWLNFSDPWLKKRYHKRRLTYPTYLNIYANLLKSQGVIYFKTDSSSLFNDSLTYFQSNSNFQVEVLTYEKGAFCTEYEIKKADLPIYYLKGVKI
ncbi:MAG: tRNA (guanosine(46)-N7)-methyltransferase TrmB [Acholeplasmatales bacterium]|jgi:tRNA (guanine-N7-)-methyltransferase|nr:tRNA (guanosine(46)-N7)-methyltransferase TrmB [Acholeplasmatales bacterium]